MPYKIYSADNPIIQRLNPKPFRINLPRYCPQDITGFYTIDANINPLQDAVNYCPQDISIYENVVSGSPTVPSILTTDTALWLDANDVSTITLESGAVSEWRDKSGNNRHATQSNASNRPLLVSGGLNGTDVIRFTQDDLLVPSLVLTGSAIDVYVIANIQNTSNDWGRLLSLRQTGQAGDWNNSTSWVVIARNSSNQSIFSQQNNTGTSTYPIQWGQFYLLHSQLNSSQIVIRADTNIVATKNGTSSINSTDGLRIGQSLNTYDENWDGDISQIIIFPRVLTQAERELVEGYLAWSTGLEGNLPVSHPYKNSYPGIVLTPTLTGDFYTIDTYPNLDLGVSVSPSSVLENSGTPFVFTFTLSSSIPYNTTVNYTVSGTATSGVDYPNQTGTATITAGQTSVDVSITPTGDTTVESDETIIITINNAMANSLFIAFGSQISATGTITNDD